jgi:hypothetical protein
MKWTKKIKKRTETITPSEQGIIEFMNVDKMMHLKPEKISLPKWYKDMPVTAKLFEAQEIPDLTIKRCIPVLDALTTGYHLVTTVDYRFGKNEETGEYTFEGPENFLQQKSISMHPTTQISTMNLSSEYINYAFKWSNSWLIKTPPGYSCLFTHPLNDVESPFKSLDAIVDTDNFFMPVLFPFLMKENFEGIIPAGTPVIQIIPFKRDDWEMKINDKFNEELEINYQAERNIYESGRYDQKGQPIGGMYKRDYRVKKRYT